MGELNLAIQSLGAIKSIAEGLIALRDESKVAQVRMELFQRVIEVQQVLMKLQQENATVLHENQSLKNRLQLMERKEAQLQGYELVELIAGVFVHAAEPLAAERPKPPYLCQACYDTGAKSVLSFQRAKSRLEPATLQCPTHARHALQLPRGVNWDMLVNGIRGDE